MGAVLIRSSFSANIKERRDCSTALFDGRGRMVAQAEHIPVHLGAMPDAVAAVMRLALALGEVAFLNDPYAGGTHLPDVTLVSRSALGFAVSRAHHADVGGMEPASLPAFSRELYQEGLIIPPTPLSDEVMRLFVSNARNPDERRGDLRAQIAAHGLAERRIDELCQRRGRERVVAAMDELYAYSERMVRAAIALLPDGRWSAEDVVEAVDGDLVVRATVEVGGAAIGGGQGACLHADGPSGVHVAMSNTLITPVEALELSYPLRVERWHLREGSGGHGARRGGDGVVRELRVLEDCRVSVLAERRAHGPHGASGGGAG